MTDERKFTFNFTETQANVILQALGNVPYVQAAPLIQEMQSQVQNQLVPVQPTDHVDEAAEG